MNKTEMSFPRDREPGEIIYGRHAVLEAFKQGEEIEKVFLLQTKHLSGILVNIRRNAEASGVPVLFAPREKLDRLAASDNHQGVVGILSAYKYAAVSEILDKPSPFKLILALDHLEDPQNLGSLLRTCDAVGVSGVVLPRRRSAGLSAGAAKSSAGAMAHVPVARVSNLHQTLLDLRKRGFALVGADQSASKTYREIKYTHPLVLVLGNEHKGLSFLLKNTCDVLASIPMTGHLGSLNVSVAGAVILYEIALQLGFFHVK